MKNMKRFITVAIFVVFMMFVFSTNVIASDETEFVRIYGHLSDEDFLFITQTDAEPDYEIYEEDINFEGVLFLGILQKQAIKKVSVRSGPGKMFDIVDKLYEGDTINIIGLFSSFGENDWIWYLLEDGGYVNSNYFEDLKDESEPKKDSKFKYELNYDVDDVDFFDSPQDKRALQKANIRSGPGMKYDIIKSLSTGDVVTAIGICDGVDCEWPWYLLDDGTFVSAHLLEDY